MGKMGDSSSDEDQASNIANFKMVVKPKEIVSK